MRNILLILNGVTLNSTKRFSVGVVFKAPVTIRKHSLFYKMNPNIDIHLKIKSTFIKNSQMQILQYNLIP